MKECHANSNSGLYLGDKDKVKVTEINKLQDFHLISAVIKKLNKNLTSL